MKFRQILTIVTIVLVAVVVYFAWPELVKAWGLADNINWWIMLLLIPAQFLSYYFNGGVIFSYLRRKGQLKDTSHWKMARISLELNFVNHILPIGGAAGFSYLGWILKRHGVSPGKSTAANLVRYILTFLGFVLLLIVAALLLILDHMVNRVIIMICVGLLVAAILGTVAVAVLVSHRGRLMKFSGWLGKVSRRFTRWITRGKHRQMVNQKVLDEFFDDLHDDYLSIKRDGRVLIVPFIWATIANMFDVILIWICFWALGTTVNPAAIFIAYGLSSIGGVVSALPGGAGVYEIIMIAFLSAVGLSPEVAIAGTILARVTLVLGTIVFGYFFYQLTVNKYGKAPTAIERK